MVEAFGIRCRVRDGNGVAVVLADQIMTEQDKAYEINELTHRLEAAKLHLDAIISGAISGDIKMFRDRIKEFESRIMRII